MKQLTAFTCKEFMELVRSGKIYILLSVFVMFGIMNPAIAKLTPWMMDLMSESLAQSGITVTDIEITAMTSWEQYYKNMPMELIVIVLMFGGVLTSEFQKGTLINMLTKGLSRWKILASKAVMVLISYSVCYFISFGITYGYNAYFWGNNVASHVFLGALLSYLLGLFWLSLIFVFSVFMKSGISVIMGVGTVYAVTLILGMIGPVADYLPVKLSQGFYLLSGEEVLNDFIKSVIVTLILLIICAVVSVAGMNKRKM